MSVGDVVMTIYVLFCMGCFFALGRISMRFGGAYREGFDVGWDKGWEARDKVAELDALSCPDRSGTRRRG